MTLEKTLESPLDGKEIKPVNKGLMLKLKLQYFGHLMQRTDSLGKTLMLGQQRTSWLDGTNSIDMSLSRLQELVKVRGALRPVVHRVAKSQT